MLGKKVQSTDNMICYYYYEFYHTTHKMYNAELIHNFFTFVT